MTRKLSIVIAAGLMLAGRAYADDQDQTKAQDQDKTSAGIGAQVKVLAKDQRTGTGEKGIGEQVRVLAKGHGDRDEATEAKPETKPAKANEGLGEQVRTMAKDQRTGTGDKGIGEQVRTMAQAHQAVHEALAEKAGEPADRPALPAQASATAAAKRGPHDAEVERAAKRHTEKMAAGEEKGDTAAAHHGGRGKGMGPGGDETQAAEMTRSGMMHGGTGTSGGTGGMGPGGMH